MNNTGGTTRRGFTLLALASPFIARAAHAEDTVRVGMPYPLSGATASAGTSLRDAMEVALDIINNAHPELEGLPLAANAGLKGLGNRRLEAVFADHQGNPSTAQSQTLRLITQEKVVALCGAYQSSCTLTASAVAERYGIPFVAGEAVALSLTQRGFKWFFRTTPIGPDFGRAYADFITELKTKGQIGGKIAVVNENTEYGTSISEAILKAMEAKGLQVGLHIPYSANSPDVSSQVLQLKGGNPDVVIFASYTSDSILFIKTMRNLNYKPAVVIGDDSGFSDASFIEAVGDIAEGAINRSSFDPGKPASVPFKVNEMFKKRTGRDMDDTSARGLQAFLVLADAIDHAGSTEPAKIQAALKATNLTAPQLIMGFKGVKFDDTGQNTLAATLLVQLRNKKYVAVWPAEAATAALVMPFKGWG